MSQYIPIGDYVLYNDHHLVAFNKPASVPVQPDPTGDASLLQLGSTYCKKQLQLIHRIDRPVSGLVLLGKRKDAMQALHQQFRERTVQKTYLAVVGNAPVDPSGTLTHYLRKQKGKHRVQVFDEPTEGAQKASLSYVIRQQTERYYLLEITLHTGRYHQIRAQLAHIGCPIRGDAKYGFRRRNPERNIDLHSWKLSFKHPRTGVQEEIIAPPPENSLWDALLAAE